MKWKKLEGTRQISDHQREDLYTLHLTDGTPPEWILCNPGGHTIDTRKWRPSELADNEPDWIDDLVAWADDAIARPKP